MEIVPNFKILKKNLKQDKEGFTKIKVAILGDSSTQFINTALKGYGIEEKLDIEVYEADYDMINQEIYNLASNLYTFLPDFVIIIPSSEKLLQQFYKKSLGERSTFAEHQKDEYLNLYEILQTNLKTKVLLFNFPFINDSVFGHFSNKVSTSFPYQLRKLNFELMELAVDVGNLFIFDIAAIQARYGLDKRFETKFYVNAKMVFSLEILPLLAKELTDIILAIKGTKLRKCLILDLDNTTWGGVIGDDGMEGIQIGDFGIGKAFTELQSWAKELKKRGVILCVCSKNTDHIAREPFEKHPDMVLRLADISVFVANWENKADNIRYIKKILNIGYDAMVFLDDNPFERNLVRTELPAVTVPELPKDPADYVNYVRSLNLFETASFSGEDNKRTKRYQEEANRVSTKQSFKSIDGYLQSLEMKANAGAFTDFSLPRIAQLTQRSNQFNLRTIRFTEEDIRRMQKEDNYITFQVALADKYGEYGLISVVIGEKRGDELFLNTWIMSCRVLKRDVEKFVLNQLVNSCKQEGITQIIGEYIPTAKNGIVKDHYKNLGFKEKETYWYLDIKTYQTQKCYIDTNAVTLV